MAALRIDFGLVRTKSNTASLMSQLLIRRPASKKPNIRRLAIIFQIDR